MCVGSALPSRAPRRSSGSVDLVERLEKSLSCDARKGLPDGLADPVAAVEGRPVRIINEFDDMDRPAHDDDESGRLLEKPRLSRGYMPPRRF